MSEVTKLNPETISQLQRIRRANAGIQGCIAVLNEHGPAVGAFLWLLVRS